MNAGLFYTIISLGALIIGLGVGVTFGTLQHKALLRDQIKQANKDYKKRRLVVPSSFRRIFYLVISLLVIQYAAPILFHTSSTQWVLTAGIIVGYGWTLVRRLRTHKDDYVHIALV
jgi:hypothetical protein